MRAEVTIIAGQANDTEQSGAGVQYLIKTPTGVYYMVYIDVASDVAYRKSTDGITWELPITIFTGTVTALSVWYDRWSDIAAGLIHMAYQESGTDDTRYRTIDTESSDALSTETTIMVGTSTAAGGALSICRARGGNVYCATMIDAGAEGGFFRLPNANVPNGAWDAARATVWEAVGSDQIILVPGWAADNQDMMAFFWDSSADEISRKLYDDSANSWAETSIATTMVDGAASVNFPHFAAAVDIANSRNLLVAWSAIDLLNADLRCWHVTESAITEVTNVVQNSTDDQGLAAIGIDTTTGYWYAFYAGKSDGSEAWPVTKLYYKISTDSGSTWGAETLLSIGVAVSRDWLICTPRFTGPFLVATQLNPIPNELKVSVLLPIQPRALSLVGVM